MFFSLEKGNFYQKHWQTLFLINFAEKNEGQETSNFWPLCKKAIFSTSKYQLICSLRKFFCLKNVSKHSFWSIWTRENKVRKLQIFDQNYNLAPLQKGKFCKFLKSIFFSVGKVIFYQKHWQTLFLINLAQKSDGQETSNFWPKSWTNHFANNANFWTSKYQLFVV